VKKIAVITVALICLFYSCGVRDNQELYETVKADFAGKYADYQFIDCGVREGDLVVAYVQGKFKNQGGQNSGRSLAILGYGQCLATPG
jgi:hypothetical protein